MNFVIMLIESGSFVKLDLKYDYSWFSIDFSWSVRLIDPKCDPFRLIIDDSQSVRSICGLKPINFEFELPKLVRNL